MCKIHENFPIVVIYSKFCFSMKKYGYQIIASSLNHKCCVHIIAEIHRWEIENLVKWNIITFT